MTAKPLRSVPLAPAPAPGSLESLVRAIVQDELARQRPTLTADEYLSPEHAAALADVSPASIRRWVREGKLERHSAGKHVRVRRSDLERFLQGPRRTSSNDNESAADFVARVMR